jgi:shikimate dehydrogenase
MHNAALLKLGIAGEYKLYPVAPDDPDGLRRLLGLIRAGELHGLNVTIPHKQAVIPLLDELGSAAGKIGAVNTIYMHTGRLVGENTDAPGFLKDLYTHFPEFDALAHPWALVLGAGGSARAVVYALAQRGWRINILARRLEQAQQIAALYPNLVQCMEYVAKNMSRYMQQIDSEYALIVNTTPIGMYPHVEKSPWPADLSIDQHIRIYDLVYNPAETMLLRQARGNGCLAVNGGGMLVEQAALAFEYWLGTPAPRDTMRQAFLTRPRPTNIHNTDKQEGLN